MPGMGLVTSEKCKDQAANDSKETKAKHGPYQENIGKQCSLASRIGSLA